MIFQLSLSEEPNQLVQDPDRLIELVKQSKPNWVLIGKLCGCQHRYAYHWFKETYMRSNQPKITREQKELMQKQMVSQLKQGKDLDAEFKRQLINTLQTNDGIKINKTDYSIVFNNLRRTKEVADLLEARKMMEFQAKRLQKETVNLVPEQPISHTMEVQNVFCGMDSESD